MRKLTWWQYVCSWMGQKEKTHAVSKASANLSMTQREISEETERTFASYRMRLQDLAERLNRLDERGLSAEGEAIREAQQTLRRSMRRAALGERTTHELMNEWHDWSRYAFQGPLAESIAQERCEMLRSELALRGMSMDKEMTSATVDDDRESIVPIIAKQNGSRPIDVSGTYERFYGNTPEEDGFREWNETIAPILQADVERMDELVEHYPPEFGDAKRLADLFRRRREAYGRLRLLDRLV